MSYRKQYTFKAIIVNTCQCGRIDKKIQNHRQTLRKNENIDDVLKSGTIQTTGLCNACEWKVVTNPSN